MSASVSASSSAGGTTGSPLYHRNYRSGGGPDRKVFDQAYLDRLAQGDPETEGHFLNYFGPLLLIKLRARLRSPQLVEDARQETFLRVLKIVPKERRSAARAGFGGFVNSVCENAFSLKPSVRALPFSASARKTSAEQAEGRERQR